MIDDENLRVLHTSAILVIETFIVRRTAASQAVAAVTADFVPDLAQRLEFEITERAVGGRYAPFAYLAKLRELFIIVEQALAASQCELEPPQAQIVSPALYEDGGKLAGNHSVEQWQVFVNELLLQADCVRRDDDLRRCRLQLRLLAIARSLLSFALCRR